MEFVPVLALGALILKFVDFLRYVRAGDMNGIVTQLIVWLAGVGGLLLAAQTQWAEAIPVGDESLSGLSVWDLIFVGLTIGSTASVIKDVGYKALDNTNSAKIPTLLPVGPVERSNKDVG